MDFLVRELNAEYTARFAFSGRTRAESVVSAPEVEKFLKEAEEKANAARAAAAAVTAAAAAAASASEGAGDDRERARTTGKKRSMIKNASNGSNTPALRVKLTTTTTTTTTALVEDVPSLTDRDGGDDDRCAVCACCDLTLCVR
jgi:pyruvate/2-oxoglutarate dehydrogenase complex dihydrolipoamide acyltransferase (E2) component